MLFNRALAEGLPAEWTMHTIVLIHKSGDPLDPDNYRIIMIGHTLAKFLGAVLEVELSSYAKRVGLRAPGFDGRPVWEGPDDLEGLDASAADVVEHLAKESPNIKLGVGGFSQGAATSLYITACSLIGSYSDGTRFPCQFQITSVLSGWFPCAQNIETRFLDNIEAGKQAKRYSIFLGHGTSKYDQVVSFKLGEKAASVLQHIGFDSITFKTYKG
ncbi:hypothetical protein L7F22_016473 [Adiantum nelumboides]|nr:hypothetical protein [Adiantum nelumboides]